MAGYIGTQAVSVNTTSATISDDLAVGDDATITGDLDVDGTTNLDVVDIDGAVDMASTLQLDGAVTLGVAGTSNGFINSPSGIFVNIDSDNNQTDRFFDIRKDSTDGSGTLLFQVAETGAVTIPATALVTGVLTTTAAAVFNGGFTSNGTAATFASSTSDSPNIIFKNTTNDANAPIMDFITDKGAAGADNDSLGLIRFTGDNDAQEQITFARVLATVADASDGAEGGKLELQVATHDGEIKSGLIINDGSAEDEIDVTIGFGTASNTIISGKVLAANGGQGLPSHSFSGDTNTGMFSSAADMIGFSVGATEAARITSDGQVLIGATASQSVNLSNGNALQIQGLSSNTSGISTTRHSNDSGGPYFNFGKSRGAADGAVTAVADNDILGQIFFSGADGTDILTPAASIQALVDGTPGGNDMPGRLVFSTTADGAATATERLRISSDGLVTIPNKLIVSAADGVRDEDYMAVFQNLEATAGRSFGVTVQAGSNGSDIALNVVNKAADTALLRVFGNGTTTIANTLTLTDGNLVVAAGHGVDFSAQTASSASGASTSSEILDHYEEGTWTPVINGSTTTGSGTYGSQSATYTKIGRVVTFEFAITWTDHTGAGSLQVGGFPFGAGSQTYYTIQLEGVSLLSNYIAPAARVESSGSISLLIQSPVAGGNRAAIAMDTAGSINGGGTYQV